MPSAAYILADLGYPAVHPGGTNRPHREVRSDTSSRYIVVRGPQSPAPSNRLGDRLSSQRLQPFTLAVNFNRRTANPFGPSSSPVAVTADIRDAKPLPSICRALRGRMQLSIPRMTLLSLSRHRALPSRPADHYAPTFPPGQTFVGFSHVPLAPPCAHYHSRAHLQSGLSRPHRFGSLRTLPGARPTPVKPTPPSRCPQFFGYRASTTDVAPERVRFNSGPATLASPFLHPTILHT